MKFHELIKQWEYRGIADIGVIQHEQYRAVQFRLNGDA